MDTKYIYLGYSEEKKAWKLGVTKNVEQRGKQLKIKIEHVIPCDASLARVYESLLHLVYGSSLTRVVNEWYVLHAGEINEIKAIKSQHDIHELADQQHWFYFHKIGWIRVENRGDWNEDVQRAIRKHRQGMRVLRESWEKEYGPGSWRRKWSILRSERENITGDDLFMYLKGRRP